MIASIIIIVLYAIELGISMAEDGKEHVVKESFPQSLIMTLIMLLLMYFAGTFDKLLRI